MQLFQKRKQLPQLLQKFEELPRNPRQLRVKAHLLYPSQRMAQVKSRTSGYPMLLLGVVSIVLQLGKQNQDGYSTGREIQLTKMALETMGSAK